jgi:hypothetical protein
MLFEAFCFCALPLHRKGEKMFCLLKNITRVFLALAILFLCSCVGGQQTTQSSATLESVKNAVPLTQRFNNVVFAEVQATDEIRQTYPEALGQFEAAMISHLRGKNVFTKVDQDTSKVLKGKTLRVEPSIQDMRIAGTSARVWGGPFAGSSYMNVTVKLVDVLTSQALRTKTITSANNAEAASWSFGASDRSLPTDMGQIVGEYVYTVVPSSK